MTTPDHRPTRVDDDREEEELPFPSFSEQIAEQLGGVRGLFESSIPVAVFVVTNIVWALRPALILSVLVGLGIAGWRLSRKEPIRHALNGLFGIAIGAVIASSTGQAKDFHLPTIALSLVQAAALIVSVVVRRPLIGWFWSVTVDGGSDRWRTFAPLLRMFGWLTVLWAAVYVVKVSVLTSLYLTDRDDALGIARLVLGYPPYALLLLITVYAVRRVLRQAPDPDPAT